MPVAVVDCSACVSLGSAQKFRCDVEGVVEPAAVADPERGGVEVREAPLRFGLAFQRRGRGEMDRRTLWRLVQKECAYSLIALRWAQSWYSGHESAMPAHAASMWSQTSRSTDFTRGTM